MTTPDPAVGIATLPAIPALAPLLARAILPRPGGRATDVLPARGATVRGVTVDRANLLAYQRLCSFTVDDRLPVSYPHMLGFPLQAHLITAADFPLPMVGLVHLANEITVERVLTAGDPLDITVTPGELRPHAKGRTIDMITTIDVAGERVWHGRSRYLHREPGGPGGTTGTTPAARREGGERGTPDRRISQIWRLRADLGRRYGAVSGDVNPIHLSALSARAFGFRRAIAHGMWTYPRTLAALGPAFGYRGSSAVRFLAPVPLPGSVALIADVHAGPGGDRAGAALVAPHDPARVYLSLRAGTGADADAFVFV